jgi:hypothetical protein
MIRSLYQSLNVGRFVLVTTRYTEGAVILVECSNTSITLVVWQHCKLYRTKTMMLSLGLLLTGVLALSCLSASIFKQKNQALAQQYI